MKLICLTYAGGNRYSYRNLMQYIDKTIDFVTLELPGRGGRRIESLIENLDDLTDDLYNQIQPFLVSDYMIYGHSMGAMLGNLLIHKLNDNLKPLPIFFLATGCSSPKKRHLRRKLHHLNNIAFHEALKHLGGMPDEVIENEELLGYVTPILRNDIKAIETYVYKERSKYDVPIMLISGAQEGLNEEDVINWQDETSANFKYSFLSGGHFFIDDHPKYIADIMNYQFIRGVRTIKDKH